MFSMGGGGCHRSPWNLVYGVRKMRHIFNLFLLPIHFEMLYLLLNVISPPLSRMGVITQKRDNQWYQKLEKACHVVNSLSFSSLSQPFYPILSYSQQLKFRSNLRHQDKSLPRRSISCMIYFLHIWTHFPHLPKNKNILWYWFSDGYNMLNHISLTKHWKVPLYFVTVGYGSGCFSIAVCCSLLGLRLLLIVIITVFVCINPLLKIIFFRIRWTSGALWFHWSIQGCG